MSEDADLAETVAELITALRKSLPPKAGRKSRLGHMSIEDFAEHLGTTKTRVIDWERGDAYPDAINRARLASASDGRYEPGDFMRTVDPDPLATLSAEVSQMTVGLDAIRKVNTNLRQRVGVLERELKEIRAQLPPVTSDSRPSRRER